MKAVPLFWMRCSRTIRLKLLNSSGHLNKISWKRFTRSLNPLILYWARDDVVAVIENTAGQGSAGNEFCTYH